MKGILVGSGNYFDHEKFLLEIKDADTLIAVDGGMEYYLNLDIMPDILIGDLDSISKNTTKKLENKEGLLVKKHPVEKDSTDMELALDYLIERNYSEILIFGGTGLRLDHTLANIYLLSKLKENNIHGRIIDKNNTIIMIENEYEIEKEAGKYVSILPVSQETSRISLEGFKYELDGYDMKFGSTIGISNEIVQDKAYIKIENGRVIVFISND